MATNPFLQEQYKDIFTFIDQIIQQNPNSNIQINNIIPLWVSEGKVDDERDGMGGLQGELLKLWVC